MSKSTRKESITTKEKAGEIKLPPLNFVPKQSIFSGGKGALPKSFVPKPVRVTQHRGG